MLKALESLLKQANLNMEYICNTDQFKLNTDSYNSKAGTLTGYDCKLCNNRGDYLEYRGDSPVFVPCKCMRIRKSLQQLEKSGLKNMLERYRPEKFTTNTPWQKAIYDNASDFCKNTKGWFYIGGQPGCGKTHICTSIADRLIKNGIETLYMLWREECIKLKSAICDSIDYNHIINPYKKVKALYIDDFFKTPGDAPTSADLGIAFEILNYRYNNNLITIISSEHTIESIYNLDSAIAGRIEEMAGVHLINIDPDKSKNQRYIKSHRL